MNRIKPLFIVTLLFNILILYFSYMKMDIKDFLNTLLSSILLFGFVTTSTSVRKTLNLKEEDEFSIANLVSPFCIFGLSFMLFKLSENSGHPIKWIVYLVTLFLSLEILFMYKKHYIVKNNLK
ncbi:membrane hypothetical protein [Lactococcus piscium]|nr:membrane hypothetical protein [Lactococcus piscium]